jgi:hypothetical protein
MKRLSQSMPAYLQRLIVAILLVTVSATSSAAQYCGYACVRQFGFILFQLDGTWVFTTCYSLPEMDGTTSVYCLYTRSNL